jgi:tRNA-dihydrouridine synthase 3
MVSLKLANTSPIDAVVKSGGGSGLMERTGRLDGIIHSLSHTLGSIPLTMKLRTGIKDDKRIAHKLVDKYHGVVDAITLHGRSQRQRYTRHADWDYINECTTHVVEPTNPGLLLRLSYL